MKKLFILFLLFAAPAFGQTHSATIPPDGNGLFLQGGIVWARPYPTTVTDTFTTAQILASDTVPITIVAAQSGKIIVPLAMVVRVLSTGHTPYTGSSTFLWVGNPNDFMLVTAGNSELTASADHVVLSGLRYGGNISDAASNIVGQPLQVGTSATMGGGTGTSIVVSTSYYIQ